jgi:hypothetical protein
MAFQVCRTSAGRPLKSYYTTTPPRKFIFSEREEKLCFQPRLLFFSRAARDGSSHFRR